MQEAMKTYNLVLMDQRGTGRSSPLSCSRLAEWQRQHGTALLVDFMGCFRADSIVRDAEIVRKCLLGEQSWSVLGQSFGGFCAVHYLSLANASLTGATPLKQVFITGGLPRIAPSPYNAKDVYRACLQRVTAASCRFFQLYPVDRARVAALAAAVAEGADGGTGHDSTPLSEDSRYIVLCDGSRFTMRRLASYGLVLGLSSGHGTLHTVLESAFTCRKAAAKAAPAAAASAEGSDSPLHAFDVLGDSAAAAAPGKDEAKLEVPDLRHNERFATVFRDTAGMVSNVMYWLMHESIYAQGSATEWAAQAVVQEHEAEHKVTAQNFQFFGEMVFPWMAQDYPEFQALEPLAQALATRCDWPALYDTQALEGNKVPTVATVYSKDVFVPEEMSKETAAQIGCCTVVENAADQHDGLHVNSAAVLGAMLNPPSTPEAASTQT